MPNTRRREGAGKAQQEVRKVPLRAEHDGHRFSLWLVFA
jgi:hypothetical protein